MKTAEDVMKEGGIEDVEVGKSKVFGTNKSTSVSLYCIRDGKTMMLIIAGQNTQEAQKLQDTLEKIILPSN